MGVLLLPLLLAVAYELPDAGKIPAPDAAHAARIERALETLRTCDGPALDAAVRDLALCGETALPAIVRRLNEAGPGERLLLLAAASPMPRAAPLLAQAQEDPHPAVRAWATGASRKKEPPLRDLARRYLDVLAVVEQRLYDEVGDDLKPLDDPLGKRRRSLELERSRASDDKDLKEAARKQREEAASRFALAGAHALATGELKPDLSDAVFVAFTGLLREEGDPAYVATIALVKAGEAAEPALEVLLDRESQEPKKIVRLLCAVRRDGGKGLYDGFARHRPEVKRALLEVAPEVLGPAELEPLLDREALDDDEAVRGVALDALLDLPAPAGREPARTLLDPQRYQLGDFRRAAELLARCGDLQQLELFAALPPVPPGPGGGDSQQISNLRGAAQSALRGASGEAIEVMGRRFLDAESQAVRTLGIDLVRDKDVLLERVRADPASSLARAALLRLLALHPDAADAAMEALRARGLEADTPVIQRLVAAERIDLVVALSADGDAAVRALSNLRTIDARFEGQLLAIYDQAAASRRRDALGALVACGTEAARQRCEADPELALEVLRERADLGFPCPFPFPLRRFLAGADASRLKLLARVAESLPAVEPGLFFEIYRAWGGVEGAGTEEGPTEERARLLDSLSRTKDVTSAKLLFELLIAGETKDPVLARGTLMVAARLLDKEQLARLLPLLREQVKAERPEAGERPPPWSELRARLLHAGFNALGYAQVEASLDDLCDVVLDPTLQPAAFDWKCRSAAPDWALDALRDFPIATVEPAFRRALARAEEDGRLAACDPDALDYFIRVCRTGPPDSRGEPSEWWTRGRALWEVALALADTLERLPGGDASADRMQALGGLGRYAEASAAARVAAGRARARGDGPRDGFVTPDFLETRARLYDGLAAHDPAAIAAAAEAADDPFIWNLATWYLRFEAADPALAQHAGEEAVHESAGLRRLYRDTLASVRNLEGRPKDALRLIDPLEHVPVRRHVSSFWHDAFAAEAYLQLGDRTAARHALEKAARDRRVLPFLRVNPAFARFADVFRDADESFFFDVLFGRETDG
jgi:hypothetical protein